MELIRGLHNLREHQRSCAVTIGNFDGMHTGHQHLINGICSHRQNLRTCVVSFEPLPFEYFVPPESRPHRLSSFTDKVTRLSSYPVDQLLILPFNSSMAETTAQDFVKNVLVDGLDTRYLFIGDDFKFGKDRAGSFSTLQAASHTYGFKLEQAQTLTRRTGSDTDNRISSTRIRQLLSAGSLDTAAELLGRKYSITGRVIYGAQLGRTIGFPTANIALKKHNPPLRGVFAVTVSDTDCPATNDKPRAQTDSHAGIANIGVKPTVQGVQLCLEVHLLDYTENLYGKKLNVTFLHKLRDEKKFSGIDELKAAIATDEQNARQWFQSHEHRS